MPAKIIILTLYVVISLTLGFIVRKKSHQEDYFLAGRKLTPFIFIGTMIATNLSAFTIFGTSGIGYREGLAFFPVMGFGTGFMALTFLLLGPRVWQLGKKYGLITPAEMIHKVYDNRLLSILFSFILILFTLPYIAIQPYAAGKVINQLFGIPEYTGAVITTLIIILYTLRGGLKAIAITDVFQGALMFILLAASLIAVANYYGGLPNALTMIESSRPALLSMTGSSGYYSSSILFSYIALWFFCDPMFPHIFQRLYAARSPRTIRLCAISYPLFCTIIFLIPITLGVLGNLAFPELSRSGSDSIMPLLMTHIGGDVFGTLVLTAGLAALMSTMDSQLLTLSSIFTRDLLPLIRKGSIESSPRSGKLTVIIIALCGLLIALTTDTTILSLGMTAFTGLSVLFPTVFFGLLLRDRTHPLSAILSIVTGELFVLLYHYRVLTDEHFLDAVPIILASTAAYLLTHTCLTELRLPSARSIRYLLAILLLLLLAVFPLSAFSSDTIHYIFPDWVWYYITLSLLQSTGCAVIIFRQTSRLTTEPQPTMKV